MRNSRRFGNGILNREVLVLNQNYQPHLICTAKRAICLIYLGKVEVIENYRDFVHSPRMRLSLPSVIKLQKYIRMTGNDIVLSRKNILKRDQHQCQYCGRRSVPMTIDHVIPKERGGKDTWDNLVCCCHVCNRKKGNRSPDEAKIILLRRPRKPSRIHYIRQFVKKEQTSWRPYLYMEAPDQIGTTV
ncbi:MAG: HNH endonuclease [Candidatus Neomarinimicrobiota bacterium]